MISTENLAGELSDLGEAIGLISNGGINSSWFEDPQGNLAKILSNPPQRQALMNLLDALLPPATVPGMPDGEKWHPVLGDQPRGNVYLTVNDFGSNVLFGIAADFGNPGSAGVTADVQVSLPLVSADTSVQGIAGTAAGPLRVALQAQLGLKKPPIQLDAISVVALITPPSVTLSVTLQNLDLGDGTLENVVLDPNQLKAEAFHVILGLLKQELASLTGPVATHLLGLFGLGGDGIPQFPFLDLTTNPAAVQGWFQSLVQGASIPNWLGHLAGLIGAPALAVNGTGTPADPWTIAVIPFDAQSALSLAISVSGPALQIGVQALLVPGGASGPGSIQAEAMLASIPLAGSGNAVVLPAASLMFRAPASSSAQLVSSDTLSVDSFSAGLEWNGSSLVPGLVLTNVIFNGTSYPQLDLTNADSVGAAAASAVQTAITNALGASVGSHLAALAGLVAPAGDNSSPHRVDLAALVANPARAVGAFHREVLLDGQRWMFLLGEVAGLLGLPSSISGTGTQSDPWLVSIASSGPLTINLAAWNAQTSGIATDPQLLRLGVRAVAANAPLTFSISSELLAFDLPQNAVGSASLVGGQHAALLIQPGVATSAAAGFALNASSFFAEMDWSPGSTFFWQAGVNGLTLTSNTASVGPVSLTFPLSGSFDVSNLQTTARALGISIPDLELLLRVLIARAALEYGGVPGYAIAALLGLHSDLAGLPADWPLLADPSGPGSLITDPVTALRNWLAQVATSVSSTGVPFLLEALNSLQSLLSNSLPASLPAAALRRFDVAHDPAFFGSGTYEDPWSLPFLTGSEAADLQAWLEPAGPPAAWASALATAATSAADLSTLLAVIQALGPFVPGLADAVKDLDLQQAAAGLSKLADFLTSSDGVVPLSAQVPTGGTWTAGTNIQSAHPLETQDPAAISQITAQIDSMAGGPASPRAVLFLGPAFSDHTTWQTLLGGKPSASFNFRIPNTNPGAVDLSKITDVVDSYTCDLNDDGTGNLPSLTAQIGLAVARIGQLRPGVPVILVAHSTAGVAARAFTNSNPAQIQGLITLGTPHLGTALPFLTDPLIASAVRLLQPLRSGMAAGPMRDAFDHYFSALDGFLPPASPGGLPSAAPYPAGSFTGTPTTDTGGRPAFAIGSTLAGTLLQNLIAAVSFLATQAGGAGGTTPTHLSFGVRARAGLPASSNASVVANAYLRAGLFRVALQSGAAEPARPAQFLSIDAELSRPGDWLAGEPGSGAARVRSMEFGLDLQSDHSGGLQVTPRILLHQASLSAPMLPRIDFATAPAQAQALFGAVVKAISTPPPPTTSAVSSLLATFSALGITVTNPDGSIGISADAFAAITTDPASFFEPRIAAALSSSGLAGFTRGTSSPWLFSIPGLPMTAYIEQGSWTVGLRTKPPLALGPTASLAFDAAVTLPAFSTSLSATLMAGILNLTWSSSSGGQLIAQAPPWLPPTTLFPPPTPAALTSLLNNLLPRLLFSIATTALVEAALPAGSAGNTILTDLLGPNFAATPPDALFSNTAAILSSATALGATNGAGLSSAKLAKLLQDVNQAAGLPAGPGVSLPGGLQLTASGAGTNADPVTLQFVTTAPIGGVLTLQLSLSFDQVAHPSPSGTLSLAIPLTGSWQSTTLGFGITPAGLSLSITPHNQAPIQILPTFGGLGALATGLEALLPAALDQLVASLSAPGPAPAWLPPALNLAQALGIYDSAGGFAAHSDAMKALLQPNFLNLFSVSNRAAVATAAANMINALGVSPVATASGSTVSWSFPLSGADAGTVSLTAGWDGLGPLMLLSANGVKLGAGALTISLSGGYATGAVQCSAAVGLGLPAGLGISVSPQFNFGVSTTGGALRFTSQFFPLASNSDNGPIEIELAPQPQITAGAQGPLQLVENWLLPLAANVAIKAAQAQLDTPLWTGASATLNTVLTSAKILQGGNLNTPLPDVMTMVSGAIAGLASGAGISVPLSSTLNLGIVSDSNGLGLRLSGSQAFDIGSYSLTALFGAPSSWAALSPGADFGLGLYLFKDAGGGSFTFTPRLRCAGVGLGLTGANDAPLVNLSAFRLGGFNGHFFFDAQFTSGLALNSFGGGMELLQLGLPLGLATGGGIGGNPVAASLLQSNGGSGGDSQPVNPSVDVSAWYWSAPDGDATFHIQFGGQTGIFWIGVHSGFGPIYIDQLGLEVDSSQVQLLIDGSVKVNGLTAQADQLTIGIPYKSVVTPGDWTLDLKGLALGFTAPGIDIAGGLLKSTNPDGSIEYDGLLLIQITELGFIAVGAYSTPTDPTTHDTFTSVFVFAGVFIVIGLPPIIDITGLGLGVGYNRELLPPTDINGLSSFLLVEALDNTAAIANDPMGALTSIRDQIPAKRGSLWFAAGLHGNSFVVVNVTAVLYVALDRGVTIGILGIARMALPSDDTALVSLELGLEVTFSPTSGTLLIIAQLTDNSWLLNKDCQLTGGFGYYISFPDSQFVITIGGYHPVFQKPPAFPDVPRLGYHWSFLGVVAIKGESYFALTNSCVMAGARMEATYGPDWIQVWFTAYTDFLLSWDPFFYNISAGVSLGATFSIQICFIGCVDIDISVSIGATLQVQGPPLNGSVTVDLAVATVTVSFGDPPNPSKNFVDWPTFASKYLASQDPDNTAVNTHVLTGLIPPFPSGAQPTPGTESQPWQMTTEFSFQTETRMPAMEYVDFFGSDSGQLATVQEINIAPMGPHTVTSVHKLTLEAPDAGSPSGWKAIAAGGRGEFSADPAQFTFSPVIGQVSQATYQYIDHDSIPAAAQTLPALLGIIITGTSVLENPSSPIPISTLIDSGDSRPLPFATLTPTIIGTLKTFGTAADGMAAIAAVVTTATDLSAAASLLQGGGVFSQARVASGLLPLGLPSMATRALQGFRSSGPLITPITTGLTMNPVGLALPPQINRVTPLKPIPLQNLRLRAVLQTRPLAAADAPASLRTSVNFLSADPSTHRTGVAVARAVVGGIGRFSPPVPDPLPGARLTFLRAAAAPRPTSLARSGRTLRSAELGWSIGSAHVQAFQSAESQIGSAGVSIPAGTTHLWDLPSQSFAVAVSGIAAVRVTFLNQSGQVIADFEESGNPQATFAAPAKSRSVVITCLGNSGSTVSGGLGAVTFSAASQRGRPIVGWQTGNLMPQANSSTFLGRGSCVTLVQPALSRKGKQITAQGVARLSQAVVDQSGIETWLPPSTGVVGLVLDQQDPTAAGDGDLAIAVTGATLSTPPVRVIGGARKILLYDVSQVTATDHIVVAVASRSASRLSGVVGLPGQAQEWAVRWNGAIPEHIVPDGPLTPDGSITVTITASGPAPSARPSK
jgi:large repetitive protein